MTTKRKKGFALPSSPTDIIKLADWLEIYALLSADRNSSRGDLERALRQSAVFQTPNGDEAAAIEETVLQVFLELEERSKAAGEAYPFELLGGLVRLKAAPKYFTSYIFCLLLSYFKWKAKKDAPVDPWRLFEELSCSAAGRYMRGDVFWMASRSGTSKSRRKGQPTNFQQNVDGLCSMLGEGQGFKVQPTLNRQDDKVDLVAWRGHADARSSKLVMFGQCAAGENWIGKTAELQPERFWEQWIREPKVSPLLRSFYIPYRIPRKEWEFRARSTGILFDRCRIAYWTSRAAEVAADPRYMRWCSAVMALQS